KASRYFVVVLCFAFGLLAKPMLVTMPFALLLLDFWPLGRVAWPRRLSGGVLPEPTAPGNAHAFSRGGRAALYVLVEKLPLLALSAASCVITYFAQRRGGALAAAESGPISLRLENATVGVVRYVGKIFWPGNLAVLYPLPAQIPVVEVIAAAGVIL